jgi:hypothetical protein
MRHSTQTHSFIFSALRPEGELPPRPRVPNYGDCANAELYGKDDVPHEGGLYCACFDLSESERDEATGLGPKRDKTRRLLT